MADASDVKVDKLGVVAVAGTEVDREADLPLGAGGSAANSGEGLGGTEPAMRHVEQVESFH